MTGRGRLFEHREQLVLPRRVDRDVGASYEVAIAEEPVQLIEIQIGGQPQIALDNGDDAQLEAPPVPFEQHGLDRVPATRMQDVGQRL